MESVSGRRLGEHLDEQLFRPLGMRDTAFGIPEGAGARYAVALPTDPWSGRPQALPDLSRARFDSGGAGLVTTAGDYLRFAMLLAGQGAVGPVRLLGRKTVEHLMTDQLDPATDDWRIAGEDPTLVNYGFGLGLAVRRGPRGAVPGSTGDVTWPGAGGTCWWADPREELAVTFMTHTPTGAAGRHYHRLARATVLQAIVD
jgi:CubicO group peptidase (beta-lactamase class C family)